MLQFPISKYQSIESLMCCKLFRNLKFKIRNLDVVRLLIVLVFIFVVPVTTLAAFADVPDSRPDSAAIETAVKSGWVKGYPDKTFHPDDAVNRAEATVILLKFLKVTPPKKFDQKFGDVGAKDWFAASVAESVKRGIVSGNADGSFAPARGVARMEFLKMLFAAHQLYLSPRTSVEAADVPTDSWYMPQLALAVETKLVRAVGGKFEPGKPLTRGELISLLVAFQKKATEIRTQAALNEAEDQMVSSLTVIQQGNFAAAEPLALAAQSVAQNAAALNTESKEVQQADALAEALLHLARAGIRRSGAERAKEVAAAEKALGPVQGATGSIAGVVALITQELGKLK